MLECAIPRCEGMQRYTIRTWRPLQEQIQLRSGAMTREYVLGSNLNL
jgi:hypothetical protein